MTNGSSPGDTSAAPQSGDSTAAATNGTSQQTSISPWIVGAALVISVLAALGAGLAWYQVAVTGRLEAGAQRGVLDRVAAGFDTLKTQQEESEASREALGQKLEALDSRVDSALQTEARARSEAIDAFRGEFDALTQSVEQVYRDLGRSVDSWILEETEQLLLLANQRLMLVQDAELAATALELADGKLEEVGDPALLPVRSQIAEELAALAEVPRLDVSGATLRLQAMSENIDGLALSQDRERPEWQAGEAPGSETSGEDTDGVGEFARQVIKDLSGLVRVRRVDETRLPKLTPVQHFLVNENLRLKLAGARYALMRGYPEVYRQDLQAAKEWTLKYFDPQSDAVGRFVEEIDSLSALPLDRDLPDISGSLKLLREQIDERKSR